MQLIFTPEPWVNHVNVGFVSSPGFYFNEAFVHYHTDGSNTASNVRGFDAQFVASGK